MLNLRITNHCNNNCIYCLEQSLRNRYKYKKHLNIDLIEKIIIKSKDDKINFYGGNPLLHPNLINICKIAYKNEFKSISIISNTKGLNKSLLKQATTYGLKSFSFYFNSFNKTSHYQITQNGIKLKKLINNINLLKKNKRLKLTAIININKTNIKDIYKSIYILNKKFKIKNFEIIGFFPFSRPYKKYKNKVFFDPKKYRNAIDKIFKLNGIKGINMKFKKMGKVFFKNSVKDYNYKSGILNQIDKEDYKRLERENPKCKIKGKCKYCFIQDYCKKQKII